VGVEGFGLDGMTVRLRDDGNGAVGKDAVDVEDEDFDLAGARFCVFKRGHSFDCMVSDVSWFLRSA
jgi:hypothetical protein